MLQVFFLLIFYSTPGAAGGSMEFDGTTYLSSDPLSGVFTPGASGSVEVFVNPTAGSGVLVNYGLDNAFSVYLKNGNIWVSWLKLLKWTAWVRIPSEPINFFSQNFGFYLWRFHEKKINLSKKQKNKQKKKMLDILDKTTIQHTQMLDKFLL